MEVALPDGADSIEVSESHDEIYTIVSVHNEDGELVKETTGIVDEGGQDA